MGERVVRGESVHLWEFSKKYARRLASLIFLESQTARNLWQHWYPSLEEENTWRSVDDPITPITAMQR